MVVRIKLVSDIHLEVNNIADNYVESLPKKEGTITVCVLAGDIGNPTLITYRQFLVDARNKYDHVILVAGNHEYYNYDITEMNTYLHDLCIEVGCIFLQRESIVIDGLEFAGATLWVKISDFEQTMAHGVLKELDITTVSQRELTVAGYNELHDDDRKYLEERLNKNSNLIVISHHPPSRRMCGINNETTGFYCNDLDNMARRSLIWLSGHSHFSTHKDNMYTNCVGYPDEITFFDKDFELVV
uniref:Calcineurin-like phosphoesterase n=1 Tax=Pithovirus LCPAC404 TaxID=2506597 RepID=A0A481ZCK1_9VIRU|nr:MAG: calcineurin-like phosphoesterase [Pithovirus LCPAC404]